MTVAKSILATVLLLISAVTAVAAEGEGDADGGRIAYVVNDYRYLPDAGQPDTDVGHALCATRCNAMSFDFADYLMAQPHEIRRLAVGRELTVPLDNPFLAGRCVCTADAYLIAPNLRNRPK